jgi:uncharacterized repeat protein (TIGR02543 family)
MGIKQLNEFRILFADNHEEVFMAQDSRAATRAKETDDMPIAQITRLRVGVGVETPIQNVKFIVDILNDAAKTAGCHAAPETWIVPEGTPVIFTAMTKPGFQFDGWFEKDGTTALSTEAVAELPVNYPDDPTELAAVFEARFSPVSA